MASKYRVQTICLAIVDATQEVKKSSTLGEASASSVAALKKQLDSLNSELQREKEREQAARSQVGLWGHK
jgi:hypothetical protein